MSHFGKYTHRIAVVRRRGVLGTAATTTLAAAFATVLTPVGSGPGGRASAAIAPPTFPSATNQGPSTSRTPYSIPVAPGVKTVSIFSVGTVDANGTPAGKTVPLDTVSSKSNGSPYVMVGVPDGLGAFDNGNGTFTLLSNHELGNTAGIVRDHGSAGAFVSQWTISNTTLQVTKGEDLIKQVFLFDPAGGGFTAGTTAFNRFCSADLPSVSAFSFGGLGTTSRIFMNGEEAAGGRAFGHVVTGADAGKSYELAALGKFAWENSVANPTAQVKTIVMGTDDTSTPGGQVYMYLGAKTNAGTEVDKAGLTNGQLYGVLANGVSVEDRNTNIGLQKFNPAAPAAGQSARFALSNLGNVSNLSGAALETASLPVTTAFKRPEDGTWDPSRPNDFYFVTTDQLDTVKDGLGTQVGRSRLWRLRYDDITNPAAGGNIQMLLDGTELQNMLDNITIDKYGHILMLEDVGNAAHNGRVLQYDIATGELKVLAKHDPSRFGDVAAPGVVVAATFPFDTQGAAHGLGDEENSGIIDAESVLGPGWFLLDDQSHYNGAGTGITAEMVEGGQYLALFNPDTFFSARAAAGVPLPAAALLFPAGAAVAAAVGKRLRRTRK